MKSKTKSRIVNMGGAKKRTITTMEVDSIATKVVTESTQVALDTIEATTKTMHPLTLSTIVEIREGIEKLQSGDGTTVVPMVE
jgi:hypothetical protein